MGLFNGLNNGLSYDGINNGLQSSYYGGLVNGLMPNETTEDGNAFITVWDTRNTSAGSSNNRQIRLPLVATGSYNFVVDWGDGSKDIIRAFNAAAITHTYASAGVYTVKIKGTITDLLFTTNTDILKILEIKRWGTFKPVSVGCFNNCANLRLDNVTDIIDLSTTGTLNALVAFFQNCTSLRIIPNLSQWDVKRATTLNLMFQGATNFNQNIYNWDTSSITSFAGMFQGTTNFNGYLDIDVSNGTIFNSMFFQTSSFNQPLSDWNVSAATSMLQMFSQATVFNQPLSGWNVSNVTNMQSMFQSSTSFNQDIGNWNVSGVTNMTNMFNFASAFNNGGSPSISGWTFSTGLTSTANMFNSAPSFNQNINNWKVSGITIMTSMFLGAFQFNQPLSGWNVGNVVDMQGMFQSTNNFNQNINNWNTSKVTNMTGMFFQAVAFNQPLSDWNVSSVTAMTSMFAGSPAFNQDIGLWNVSACTSFSAFMNGKTPATYSQVYLDSIYSGWTRVLLQTLRPIDFGSVKYSSGNTQSVAGRGLLSRPNQSLAISNCVNNGSGLIRVTSAAQTLVTGNKVFISGVLGATQANGPWIVTVINTTTIDLQGSTFIDAYTSGGALRTGYGWTITDGGAG